MADRAEDHLRVIVEDINYLKQFEEILPDEVDGVISDLKSEEAKAYVRHLSRGSKPETALREAFFAGQSILNRSIFGDLTPEVREKDGFIDYYFTVGGKQRVLLELKPLFKAKIRRSAKSSRIEKLERMDLNYEEHLPQILKYLRGELEQECEYEILSNLADWSFFNTDALYGAGTNKPFLVTNLRNFIDECKRVGSIEQFLKRQEYQARQEELGGLFFRSLKGWVNALSRLKCNVDERRKLELIIHLLNKFVFIQTLDYYAVVDFRMLQNLWKEKIRKWSAKGKGRIIKEFLAEIDSWFFEHYDTELFREGIIQYIDESESNLELLYDSLELVLGLKEWQSTFTGIAGVTQFNFRRINEDVFGKAYETFLADVRKEQGVYYTPSYITEYIVENSVAKIFDHYVKEIELELEKDMFEQAEIHIHQLLAIKILDPACGSASFLIKAIRKIMERYRRLIRMISEKEEKYNKYQGTLKRSEEIEEKVRKILELKNAIGATNERELIARIILRHIHGNDIDKKALEVAKVNIWLEAVKLSPISFKYDKLPRETNRILPDLEMNLANGDSIIGLPDQNVLEILQTKFKDKIVEMSELRNGYLTNPSKTELVERIELIKSELRTELQHEFERYVMNKELPAAVLKETRSFHWVLEFWYVFFDIKGRVLGETERGFDIVLGNPPYVNAKLMNDTIRSFVDKHYFSAVGTYDVYVVFMEKGLQLLKKAGYLSFINPNKFIFTDYGQGIRNLIKSNGRLLEFVNFGDVQVFSDATTYTCLIFIMKSKVGEYEFRVAQIKNEIEIERFIDQVRNSDEKEILNPQLDIYMTSSNSLSVDGWILRPKAQQELLDKIQRDTTRLGQISYKMFVGLQITPVEVFAVSVKKDLGNDVIITPIRPEEEGEEYTIEKKVLVPILKSSDINRYYVSPKNYYVIFPYRYNGKRGQELQATFTEEPEMKKDYHKTYAYLIKKKHFLEEREEGRWKNSPRWYEYSRAQNFGCHPLPKIITPGVSTEASYAFDESGLYVDRGSYGIILDEKIKLDYRYLLALLNSKVLDYFLRSITPYLRGGWYSYQTKYLEQLPIKLPKTNDGINAEKKIVSLVKRMEQLIKYRNLIIEAWNKWTMYMKNGEKSLHEILIDDIENMRRGNQNDTWTVATTFYPDKFDPNYNKLFSSFRVTADLSDLILRIYCISGEGEETLPYEMKFSKKELMLHTYLTLLSTHKSRLQIENLEQLLQKIEIQIITPNPSENTVNIIGKVDEELRAESKSLTLDDVVRIDQETTKIDAEIDTEIFKLYKLKKEDAVRLMNILHVPLSYQTIVTEM